MPEWRRLWLAVATPALLVLLGVVVVLATGACGTGRHGRHPYLSERLLACTSSTRAWTRAVPSALVAAFAAQLPSWWCTFAQLVAMTGDARAAPAAVFAALALASLAGIEAVVYFGVDADGAWVPGHVAGAVVWMSTFFVMHALTLFACAHVCPHTTLYTGSTAVYAELSLQFIVLFVADSPAAAPMQWVLVVPMAFMMCTNVSIASRLAQRPSRADCGP